MAPEIHIASTGMIDGSAIASDISVQGRISASVDALNVSLAASAVVRAKVTLERFAIESRAELELCPKVGDGVIRRL